LAIPAFKAGRSSTLGFVRLAMRRACTWAEPKSCKPPPSWNSWPCPQIGRYKPRPPSMHRWRWISTWCHLWCVSIKVYLIYQSPKLDELNNMHWFMVSNDRNITYCWYP
jgi:hypothetical protein